MARRRSLPLRALFVILAVLAVVAVAERVHIIPPGTLDRLLGQETHRPRQPRKQEQAEPPPPVVAQPTDKIDYADVARQLDGIRVEPEKRRGYQREDWPHWLALEGGCLNAREKVLIRDSRRPATLDAKGCGVKSGDWLDPYTGERYTDPQMVDIDHRVPLEEAYASGGYDWSREKRAAYANDTSDPLTLLVSSREANRAKGSKGPEDWLPPKRDGICLYVADWILVKARWNLSMDERERVTVGNILNDCRASAGQQR
ncbi:HNH endonuclease family protein [Azospirillum sp. A1-3]|uniref:HNH endonuclease family protein n=1 Tax=Azospirillum sp. A1-3 TaxID=185874 RepID=UPI002077768D|nr:HNH endonuclease family protein [Azospirillum sp. A1-3]MCM8737071.1 HNH endonuclease family protein [Azospirillum sp. A1-3]